MSGSFGMELGRELCTALGLDANTVLDITLRVAAYEPVQLTVTRWAGSDEVDAIVSVVEQYTLTPAETENAE